MHPARTLSDARLDPRSLSAMAGLVLLTLSLPVAVVLTLTGPNPTRG